MNQCDGCNRELPVVKGLHMLDSGMPYMACTEHMYKEEKEVALMDRYWINQPSTLQPLHRMHGVDVIAPRDLTDLVTVYPVSGKTISLTIPSVCLSRGWIINRGIE